MHRRGAFDRSARLASASRRVVSAVLGFSFAFCAARVVDAQARGFAIDRFEPSERGSEWFALDTLDLRGNGRLALGVVGDWAHKPLVTYDASGHEVSALVRDQFFLHVGGAINLADTLRLSFSLPWLVVNDGDASTVRGSTLAAPSGRVLGDLRFSADLRLLGAYREGFQLALGVRAFVASGSTSAYAGDGKIRLAPRLSAAGELGAIVYALNAGFQWRDISDPMGNGAAGSELQMGAAIGVRTAEGALVIGPEIYGSSVVDRSGSFFAQSATPFEGIFGAHYLVAQAWRMGAGVGPGLTRGYGSPALRVVASLEWAPAQETPTPKPPVDSDGDGVVDTSDACVDVPGVASADPTMNGCPARPLDIDKDGIVDRDDACLDVPGVATTDPKTNGCPPPPPDRDGDGVVDADDACIDVAGVRSADPKMNGCPLPDPDRDKDGVANDKDACPDEAGTPSSDPKKNGCPTGAIVADQIVVLDQVQFKTNSDAILPASEIVLQKVLETMNKLPATTRFRIEGYTDNRGAAARNRTLSKRRAQAVVTWMVKHGVAAARFDALGLGPDRPIDSNETDEGRQQNRRVEFHIIGESGEPRTVPTQNPQGATK